MAHFRHRRKDIAGGPVSASLFFESPKIHSSLATGKVRFPPPSLAMVTDCVRLPRPLIYANFMALCRSSPR